MQLPISSCFKTAPETLYSYSQCAEQLSRRMAFSTSAIRPISSLRALSLVSTGPSLVLQHRLFTTSLILRNAESTSFTRSKQAQIASTSTTSTTAQSSSTRTGTGYNALAKAEQKVAKQQKGMARQMPGMSLENQDQPLAGELKPHMCKYRSAMACAWHERLPRADAVLKIRIFFLHCVKSVYPTSAVSSLRSSICSREQGDFYV